MAEYWVIDSELETMKIYRREGDSSGRAAELSAETRDALTTPLLPGFSVPLAAVCAPPFGGGRDASA